MLTNYNTATKINFDSSKAVNIYDCEELKETEKIIFNKCCFPGAKVLDVGCGVGRTTINLHKLMCMATGIDYAKSMVNRAKNKYKKFPIKFLVMDVKQLEFNDNIFDFCFFSFNGLDYLYPEVDRGVALKEIYRVLKPGGYFAFSSHNSLFIPNSPIRFKNFLRSVIRGQIFPYRWDFQEFGPVITHVISPYSQLKQLKIPGFKNIEIVSKYSKNFKAICLLDPYPSYVCQK